MSKFSFIKNKKVGTKLAFMIAFMIIPIASVTAFLFISKQNSIDFTHTQLLGLDYIRETKKLLVDLGQHRDLTNLYQAGDQSKTTTIKSLQSKIDAQINNLTNMTTRTAEDLNSTSIVTRISENWSKFRKVWDSSGPIANAEYHQRLHLDTLELFQSISQDFRLNLDSGPNTAILLDSVADDLPRIMSTISDIRKLGEEIALRNVISFEEEMYLTDLLNKSREAIKRYDASLHYFDASSSGSNIAIQPLVLKSRNEFQKFSDIVNDTFIDSELIAINANQFYDISTELINSFSILYDSSIKNSVELLNYRAHMLTKERNVYTLAALLLTAIAVLFAMVTYRYITYQISAITQVLNLIDRGDYEARAEVVSADELGLMATSLNNMLDRNLSLIQSQDERDSIQNSIMQLLDEVSDVARGDLTVEAQVTEDVTGAIADSFNHMIYQLRHIVTNVQAATLHVSSSATDIQANAENLAEGSSAQAEQIVDSSAALDEMAVSIQQVSENAALSATVAEQALAGAKQGASAVQNTIQGMHRIRAQVQETAKRIKRLGERSQEISEIVQLIGDIADRTSILALNASIQAARAGEAGRSFAVVAEEVERLAERSTDATKQIGSLVNTIQSETNEAVIAMEESTHEVVEGSQVADKAGQALGEIESISSRLAELIQSISLAATQQARGSDNLSKAMGEISEVTQQTATGTRQAAMSISNLSTLADELRDSVSTFKLPENAHE